VVGHHAAQRRRALPIGRVAAVAIRRRRCGTDMAKIASHGDVRAGQREASGGVVEGRAQPRRCRVARRAGCRVTRSDVVGHRPAECGGALPIGGVATVAIGGQRAAVIAVYMALSAGNGRVSAGQRKGCCAVIESRGCPICSRVADGAVLRETRGDVIGHRSAESRRALPVCGVAAVARCGSERVVVRYMTGNAGSRHRRRVHAGQCKAGRAVVERSRRPANRGVAGGAIRGSEGRARRGMNWARGLLPGSEMALRIAAIGGSDRQIVVVVDVAERAGHICVAIRQEEAGRAVVKIRVQPAVKIVAACAVGCCERGSRGCVSGIRGLLPIR